MYKKILKATIAIILSSCMLFSGCNINNNENNTDSSDTSVKATAYTATDFPNLLDVKAIPTEKFYNGNFGIYTNFIDMGAWHGYFLPQETNEFGLGGFAGPTLLAKHEYETIAINLSDTISKINLTKNGEVIDLMNSEKSLTYYPGRLYQQYEVEGDFKLILQLVYITDRTALIEYEIVNTSDKSAEFELEFEGRIYRAYDSYGKRKAINPEINSTDDGICVLFNGTNSDLEESTKYNKFTIRRDINLSTEISEKKCNYKSKFNEKITLKPKSNYKVYETQSYTFTQEEYENEMTEIDSLMKEKENLFTKSNDRWQNYINSTFDKKDDVSNDYKYAAI
ncbi:MAG: cell wall surface anchor family protein, partial [Oscillospiraceae bacterium]